MRTRRILLITLLLVALCAPAALAQLASGKLTGRVTAEREPLPGVTVVVESPSLPGGSLARVTGENGGYLFQSLPPGTYTVTFNLEGFATTRTEVKISAAQTRNLDQAMSEELTEEVTVTGATETVSTGQEISTTYESSSVEKLPIARTIQSAVALAPGVSQTGPGGNTVISGAQSYTNLYLVNGVVVNENLRGQPYDMFIEDAIQETTVQTGSVSAEYGRFSGGVINTITKSGGNEFEASARINLDNDDWVARTPRQEDNPDFEKEDDINEVYEATFGGRIISDRLWFFLAGRDRSTSATEQTFITNIPYKTGVEETRLEAKLTGAITSRHRVVGSYFEIDEEEFGDNAFGIGLDLGYVNDSRTLPLEGLSFNYNGFITPEFAIEAQYSEREFTFEGSGGDDRSFVGGTLFQDRPTGGRYYAPVFCGVCEDEERDNENTLLKASYFVNWGGLGTHDIVGGYDTFTDVRLSNNHQSASDYHVWVPDSIIDGNEVYPEVASGTSLAASWIIYWPILGPSKGTDFETNSFFLNDRWRLNANWTFNAGIRFDENDGVDAEGKPVVDDSRWSPRFGVTYDPKGDGEWLLSASWGRYVSAIANSIADSSSSAGTPAIFAYLYDGPEINVGLGPGDPGLVGPRDALVTIEDWFFNTYGGPDNLSLAWFIDIPGTTTLISDGLGSPFSDEITIGVTKRLGSRGVIRADYVRREYNDFYSDRVDQATGKTPDGFDQAFVVNENDTLSRTYDGLHLAAQYTFTERFGMGGTYTLSHLRGNSVGETAGSGAVTSSAITYPEYREERWNYPEGDLPSDQRHRLRLWAFYDIISTERHSLNVSLLQSYFSGTPYSAVGTVDPSPFVDPALNALYTTPESSAAYFFSARGAFETDDITRTDLSFNYSFFYRDLEFFVQPEILNLWDESGVDGVNTTVLTAQDTPLLDPFNPFSEGPLLDADLSDNGTGGFRGNYAFGPNFGEPEGDADYQAPRTFRVSVGVRF